MRYVGHWLAIRSYKHDGLLHRFWDRGLVIDYTDDFVVVATKRARVTEADGRKWFTKEPAVTIFSRKEWWNVICMIKKDGICYYCNIASPSIIEQGYIKYIDYDLDAKLYPNGSIKVLDEKEYKRNSSSYHYDNDLDIVLQYQMRKILDLMKKHVFPFVDAKINEYFNKYLELTKKK